MSGNSENSAEITTLTATKEVDDLMRKLVIKYNLDSNSQIIYSVGSEVGDNYVSKTIAVDIVDDKRSLEIFVKYAHENINLESMPLDKAYAKEIYFYDVLYPTLTKFAEKRGVKDLLANIPKCYGTSEEHVIALGNLKKDGYELFDRKGKMNEDHIKIVLKAFAKYHGLNFAFKDQNKENFEELCSRVSTPFEVNEDKPNLMVEMQARMIDAFLAQLDPDTEKHIIEGYQNLTKDINEYFKSLIDTSKNNHNIITKGDCWSNNIMFCYEDTKNKGSPSDVMLVDWQMLMVNSLVIDLSFCFYTVACDDELDKLDYYLRIYHEELSETINKLGSDSDILYPFSVLKQEWKQFCKFGYLMAIAILNIMLLDKEDAPDFGTGDEADLVNQFAKIKINPEYFIRLKNLTKHFMKYDFV